MNAAEQIAASRPADRVTFTPEEPVRSENPVRRIVATDVRRTLFTAYVAEYTEIEEHPVLYWKRDKIETWYEPQHYEERKRGDGWIEFAVVPGATVARRTPQVSTEPGVWRDVP